MGSCFSSPPARPSGAASRTSCNVSGTGDIHVRPRRGVSPPAHNLPLPHPRIFSLSELRVATRNFKSENILGEGGFGKVYMGLIDSRTGSSATTVAIKKLRSESLQGFEEWQSEVHFLGNLSHPHLVKLLGYCCEDTELLLVYEYMQKGSLENHLFGRGCAVKPLPWEVRLQILIGAARGLAFLHSLRRQVIYRDFKASNILLDGAYNAKISDFGLAKIGPTSRKSHVTTKVVGTDGYAAPEYLATGHLYVKSDVYAFGVVLVEVLTGLRARDRSRPAGQQYLADWVKPHLSQRRKLISIMDPHLEGRYPSRTVLEVARLALKCLENEPKNRPSMQEILGSLETLASAKQRPVMQRVHASSEEGNCRQQHNLKRPSPARPRPRRVHIGNVHR